MKVFSYDFGVAGIVHFPLFELAFIMITLKTFKTVKTVKTVKTCVQLQLLLRERDTSTEYSQVREKSQ